MRGSGFQVPHSNPISHRYIGLYNKNASNTKIIVPF